LIGLSFAAASIAQTNPMSFSGKRLKRIGIRNAMVDDGNGKPASNRRSAMAYRSTIPTTSAELRQMIADAKRSRSAKPENGLSQPWFTLVPTCFGTWKLLSWLKLSYFGSSFSHFFTNKLMIYSIIVDKGVICIGSKCVWDKDREFIFNLAAVWLSRGTLPNGRVSARHL
jgi:hypothetical protein